MKKAEIIKKLEELNVEFDPKMHHGKLGALLERLTGPIKAKEPEKPKDETIKVKNVMRKRNAYVNPNYRLERDEAELAKITGRRDLRGKIKKVIITRHMEANEAGDLVTEMEVHLK